MKHFITTSILILGFFLSLNVFANGGKGQKAKNQKVWEKNKKETTLFVHHKEIKTKAIAHHNHVIIKTHKAVFAKGNHSKGPSRKNG